MNELLTKAIENKQAKNYYGSVIIYPRRFSNMYLLDMLLNTLKNDYNFYKIFDTIKAVKK